VGHFSKAETTKTKNADDTARTATQLATVTMPGGVFFQFFVFDDFA